MSEFLSEKNDDEQQLTQAVDEIIETMEYPEMEAWYRYYMDTVPEENVVQLFGESIEIEPDPAAFKSFIEEKLTVVLEDASHEV